MKLLSCLAKLPQSRRRPLAIALTVPRLTPRRRAISRCERRLSRSIRRTSSISAAAIICDSPDEIRVDGSTVTADYSSRNCTYVQHWLWTLLPALCPGHACDIPHIGGCRLRRWQHGELSCLAEETRIDPGMSKTNANLDMRILRDRTERQGRNTAV